MCVCEAFLKSATLHCNCTLRKRNGESKTTRREQKKDIERANLDNDDHFPTTTTTTPTSLLFRAMRMC